MADYNRTEAAEQVFNSKKPKGEIKYNITLDEEQKVVKSLIYDSSIIVITGSAGTGKTLVAAQTILDLIFKKEVHKVYITRPTVQVGGNLGFLKGDLDDKLNPYLDPFKDNMYTCYGRTDKSKVDKLLADKVVEGTAVQFIRGKTYGAGKVLVVDESQNLLKSELLAVITRLGIGGRIIIIGDVAQKDINSKEDGLSYILKMSKSIPEIKHIHLSKNHRHGLVAKILQYVENE